MQSVTKKKKAAIVCAAVIIGLLAIFMGMVLFPLLGETVGEWFAVGLLLFYGLMIAAVIVGVVIALRQRLLELEGGEEEDAKRY